MTDIFNRQPIAETYEPEISGELKAYLHNLLIEETEAFLEIVFKEAVPLEHIQQQAYLKGRIDLLKQLLQKEI